MIKAVIFDMDGVVVDTEELNFLTDSAVLGTAGLKVSEEEYVKHTGKPGRQIYVDLLHHHGIAADIEALVAKREDFMKKAMHDLNLKPDPGFDSLAAKLKASNYTVALASSSSKTKVQNVLSFLKIEHMFTTVVTGSDIAKSKPAPDIYLETAKRLGINPEECLTIEDSAPGVAAAKNAGMACIALLTKHTKNHNISIADKTVNSLAEISINDINRLQKKPGGSRMTKEHRSAIIISASSDIGTAMCRRWLSYGWDLFGTYRTKSPAVSELENAGVKIVHCDLSSLESIKAACGSLCTLCPKWDVLVICPGKQDPIGPFLKCDPDEWEESIKVNFIRQMRIVHELMPTRNLKSRLEPCVMFFAGSGTNNAPINYSAYIASKIALIKMCELLDAEIPDTRFAIVGPGWVKTKSHEPTLKAGPWLGPNYKRTIEKFAGNECTPMDTIFDCFEWLIETPRELMSGRNFSVVFDKWGTKELEEKLSQEPNMYKLRRHGNDWLMTKKWVEGK